MTDREAEPERYLRCEICGVAMHHDLAASHIAAHLDSFAPGWPRAEDLYPDDDAP